jgi:3-oxoacyl-[acyl-carrier protein] reductase
MTVSTPQRVLVTGAGSGIGRATALRLAGGGAHVIALDRDTAALDTLIAEAQAMPGSMAGATADVTSEADVEAAFALAQECHGGLDAVVANAGVQLAGRDAPADQLDLDVWRTTLDINLTGMFLTAKHGMRALLRSGGEAMALTLSPTGLFGCAPGYDAYSASKGGVAGLMRVLASDYAARGIRVNGVVPGYTATPMTEWVDEAAHRELLTTIPLGRAGRPEEVAAVLCFLISPDASYVTGAIWAADGGMTAV